MNKTLKNNSKYVNVNNTININEKIIFILEVVKKYYARIKDIIHVNSYERAIYQIRKWPKPITQGKELSHLEGIGKGMIEKIDTIIKTGTLPIIKEKKLLEMHSSTSSRIRKTKKIQGNNANDIDSDTNTDISNIANILGFGQKQSLEINKIYGISTISELQTLVAQGKIKLSNTQQLGLKYHTDLQKKIPRNEITEIGLIIKSILTMDTDYMENIKRYVFLAGSYPSGLKKESKDIDILIVSKNNIITLQELIKNLQININDKLEVISLGNTKFLGLINHNGIWRHLDIRMVNMESFPYAWLYYTSGKIFNKLIREKLKKKGYKLNEWGLFTSSPNTTVNANRIGSNRIDSNDKIILEGELNNNTLVNMNMTEKELLEYAIKIEKEIFILANLEYKTITERY